MLLENKNENRNCNCGCMNMMTSDDFNNDMTLTASFGPKTANSCCCSSCPKPPISTYSYEFVNMEPEQTCPEKEMTRSEMLEQIRCLSFAIVELAEYLDTHVDDDRAICLHKEYATKLRDLKDKYQKVFGPLSIYFPCNKWRWIEEPWPWERGNF